jgi:hypothetical protein
LLTSLAVAARSGVLLDTGEIGFSATGIQFDRISRDGISSTWGSAKNFPGVLGDAKARGYQLFSVNSGIYPFLQISLDDPGGVLFVAAYLNSFSPVNVPPDFGLDVHYLGDPGTTQPFGVPSFFQIQVASHSDVVLAVNEIDPGGGSGAPLNLIVEGFLNSSYADVPEPASFGLLAAGLALLWASRRYFPARTRG